MKTHHRIYLWRTIVAFFAIYGIWSMFYTPKTETIMQSESEIRIMLQYNSISAFGYNYDVYYNDTKVGYAHLPDKIDIIAFKPE